jgi:hypothetical protein
MNMSEVKTGRLNRELETRDTVERPKKWSPPQLLPEPNPEPGYGFRWIRLSTLGAADAINISSKLREGWEPVKASDHPEVQLMGGLALRFPDSIEIGGLLLCKTPIEFTEQRDTHYRDQANNQMASVDNNFMRENDPRMPLFKERSTKVTFGKGF